MGTESATESAICAQDDCSAKKNREWSRFALGQGCWSIQSGHEAGGEPEPFATGTGFSGCGPAVREGNHNRAENQGASRFDEERAWKNGRPKGRVKAKKQEQEQASVERGKAQEQVKAR